MRRTVRIALALAALTLATPALAMRNGGNGFVAPGINLRSIDIGCAFSQNDTAKLRAAIETGVCAGTTCKIPSGCKILVGSPGAGDSVAELPSNTTIECEDGTAGFVLARKSCSAVSDTPGAACTADSQCKNGTCDADYPTGDSFAPSSGSTYTLFSAASGSSNVAVKNCSVWANGQSKNYATLGGNDKPWGYCDGSGPTDVTGQGCVVTCNSSSGVLFGVACTTNGDCGAGSCTENLGDCKTNGGLCTSVPYTTAWGPSGAGKINVIDFSNASNAVIDSVTVYDHRRGDFTLKTGTSGIIRNSITDRRSPDTPPVNAWPAYTMNASVTIGAVAGYGTAVTDVTGGGWDAGIEAVGGNVIYGSVGNGLGAPTEATWGGATGLQISGPGVRSVGFWGGTGLLNCIRPKFGLNSTGGYNFIVTSPFCDTQIGAKFVAQGAGNQFDLIRGAWNSSTGGSFALGDQRGRCASGTRSGKVCVFGAGDDANIGCPTGATCSPHNDFPAEGVGHLVITGGLLHTNIANAALIRTTDGRRCMAGTGTMGGPCSVDADCGTGGQCRYLGYENVNIDGLMLYPGASGLTLIDLNTSSVGVKEVGLPGPSIINWNLSGILFAPAANGIKFPTNTKKCAGGSNAGTTCSVAADCSAGGGTCRSPVENFVASGNIGGVTTPLTNWAGVYGDVSGLKGLLTTDVQCLVTRKTADGTIANGQLVKQGSTADRVVALGTSEGSLTVGLSLNDAESGSIVYVCEAGQAQCITDSGTIAMGDVLKASASNGGRVVTGSTAAGDVIVGVANANDPATGGLFNCTYRGPAVQAGIASPFTPVRKASDTSSTILTPADDPELTFATGANKKYAVDGILMVSATGTTGDIAGGFNIPGSSTGTVNVWYYGGNAAGNPQQVTGDNTTGKLGEVPNGTTAFFVQGTITTVSSGTTVFRWAQNAGPNGTTTLLTGSYLRLEEIP